MGPTPDLEIHPAQTDGIDLCLGVVFKEGGLHSGCPVSPAKMLLSESRSIAEALRPLAGNGAYWLFSRDLIAAGMLGVPVLAASSAYAVSEAAKWRGSLADRPHLARGSYAVIAAGLLLGLALDYAGINAVAMLFWSAVLNGVLAPPLIVIVLLLTSSRQVIGIRLNPSWLKILGWITVVVMIAASVAMFVTWK